MDSVFYLTYLGSIDTIEYVYEKDFFINFFSIFYSEYCAF